jgi:short-subunit dehydrogenase
MRRVVVVTGASGGVGRATALAFASRGAAVALLARGQAGLEAAAKEVESRGGVALSIPVDVADANAVDRAASSVEAELGPIDVWVNNTMVTVFGPVTDLTDAEIRRVTEVTYLGQVHGTMAALARMRPRNSGVIVSVGSALAFRSIPLQAAYCGAKAGVRGFMDSLRTELLSERSGVRVTQVHLPAVNTPQFGWCRSKVEGHPQPVPPIYQPEVAAAAIVAAAERPHRQRVLGSWNRMIVAGQKVAPGVLDHFAARTGKANQIDPKLPSDPADDLFVPEDDEPGSDRGAHGPFDDRSGGVVDPSFLRSLPSTVVTAAASAGARVREVMARR